MGTENTTDPTESPEATGAYVCPACGNTDPGGVIRAAIAKAEGR